MLGVFALAMVADHASAAAWIIRPSIAVEETFTDNVDLAPTGLARSDLVTQITPSLAFSGVGAHAQLLGLIKIPVLLYAQTGAENNNVYPEATILGSAEVVDKFLYLDGAISITQPYLSAFGAQPNNLSSATNNRYSASSYRITPYIKGLAAENVEWELRNSSIWSITNGAPINVSNAYTNETVGHIGNSHSILGWFADLDFLNVKFSDQGSQRMNLVRMGPRYAYDPQLRLLASAGYEENNFPYSSYRGATYGAGIEWRPSERTSAVANIEHRFFGTSVLLTFDHRTPLSVWNVSISRNVTNYPQQLATPATSTSVDALLNELFISRVPDPKARQEVISNYIENQSLPSSLTGAVNYYSQEILLANKVSATAGLTGSRNNIFFTAYYLHNQPIAGSGASLPGFVDPGNNNTQWGGNLVWTHRVTPLVNLNLTLYALRTEANAPLSGWTNQGTARLELSRSITAQTTAFAGVRYQALHSDVATDYNEAAVFAGLSYRFK